MKSVSKKTRGLLSVGHARAFTLIELLVAIGIFTIITSIVFVSQRQFGGSILLTNLGYDVALSIRQAQVYGVSVKQTSSPCVGLSGSDKFQCSYGIHFEKQGYYILFADFDGSGFYDKASDDGTKCKDGGECLNFFKIQKGNFISRFCAGASCTDTPDINQIDSLDIIFQRPNPEPIIHVSKGGTVRSYNYPSAFVTVSSPQGITRNILVSAAGQISVQ